MAASWLQFQASTGIRWIYLECIRVQICGRAHARRVSYSVRRSELKGIGVDCGDAAMKGFVMMGSGFESPLAAPTKSMG